MNSVVPTFSSLEFCFTGVPDALTQHLTCVKEKIPRFSHIMLQVTLQSTVLELLKEFGSHGA